MANRYYLKNSQFSKTDNCVFISHQQKDKEAARDIANYINKSGVDIYFDEYDNSIDRNNPQSVVNAIKTGVRRSTYMLCVLSNNALKSHWMPWEIGYGYDLLMVYGITIKELSKAVLPEFLQVVPVLRGTKSLNTFIASILGKKEESLIYEQKIYSASYMNHPLDKVLDWQM